MTDEEIYKKAMLAIDLYEAKIWRDFFAIRFKINGALLAISATMLSINATLNADVVTRVEILTKRDDLVPVLHYIFRSPALYSILALAANLLCILSLSFLLFEHIYVYNRRIEDIQTEKKQHPRNIIASYERGYILLSQKRLKIFSILDYVAYCSFLILALSLTIKLLLK